MNPNKRFNKIRFGMMMQAAFTICAVVAILIMLFHEVREVNIFEVFVVVGTTLLIVFSASIFTYLIHLLWSGKYKNKEDKS